ncbi:hypothetical protein, partial [Escherichia coli]|uniref:hypothetical protein n=1 Tax=Escherichia coli TaxID=562 RepID=UPI001953356E
IPKSSIALAMGSVYIKARRHWRNAETYEWDVPREELLRRDYLRISHEQEQVGDRQTFAFLE